MILVFVVIKKNVYFNYFKNRLSNIRTPILFLPVHSFVVIGHLVVKIGSVTEHADAQRLLSGNPLINRSGAVVEIPGYH